MALLLTDLPLRQAGRRSLAPLEPGVESGVKSGVDFGAGQLFGP